MNLSLATKNDAQQIAQIHCQEIRPAFLSRLGEKFLTKMYEAMMGFSQSFVIVAEIDNKIAGFVSGCRNVSNFYKYFFKNYFFSSFLILLPKLFNLITIRKIWELLSYSKVEKELPQAELVSIAVTKNFQGEGMAQKIFENFVAEIKKRNIKRFKVIVGANFSQAIRFYEKLGFKEVSSIHVHRDHLSKVYVYEI